MDYEPEGMPVRNPAADRTNLPGILLLVIGILNVLASLYLLLYGVRAMMMTPEQRQEAKREMEAQQTPQQREQMKQLNWSMDKILDVWFGVALAWGGLALICGLVTLLGGWQMRSLHSYGLAVTGSVLALIPCLSPTACCGVGEGIGIWALVVLLSSDVKSAFR